MLVNQMCMFIPCCKTSQDQPSSCLLSLCLSVRLQPLTHFATFAEILHFVTLTEIFKAERNPACCFLTPPPPTPNAQDDVCIPQCIRTLLAFKPIHRKLTNRPPCCSKIPANSAFSSQLFEKGSILTLTGSQTGTLCHQCNSDDELSNKNPWKSRIKCCQWPLTHCCLHSSRRQVPRQTSSSGR